MPQHNKKVLVKSVFIGLFSFSTNDIKTSHGHGVLHGVHPALGSLKALSPPFRDKKHHVPPLFLQSSGTEVPIPWFTDIIYKIIQNFKKLKLSKFYLTSYHFHATVQSLTCTTYGKYLRESIMVVPTPK